MYLRILYNPHKGTHAPPYTSLKLRTHTRNPISMDSRARSRKRGSEHWREQPDKQSDNPEFGGSKRSKASSSGISRPATNLIDPRSSLEKPGTVLETRLAEFYENGTIYVCEVNRVAGEHQAQKDPPINGKDNREGEGLPSTTGGRYSMAGWHSSDGRHGQDPLTNCDSMPPCKRQVDKYIP